MLTLASFFTRGYIVKKFGLDDLFIAIAIILGSAQTVTCILQVENGRGKHSSELETYQSERMLMVREVYSRSWHTLTIDISTFGLTC